MRRRAVLWWGLICGVAGIALLVMAARQPMPEVLPPTPASPIVQTRIVEHDVYRWLSPTDVPTLAAWQLATPTPGIAYEWPTAETDTSCYYRVRAGCVWQTPLVAPTGQALGDAP